MTTGPPGGLPPAERRLKRQRLARRATVLAMALSAFCGVVTVAFDWEGMVALALGLLYYGALLAHLPLGLVAVFGAIRSGRHLPNLWIHGYFLVVAITAGAWLAAVNEWDVAAEAAIERVRDPATAQLRAALSRFAYDGAAARAAVEAGARIDVVDETGATPLMLVADNGDAALLDTLLGRGADVDARDVTGASALHYAAAGGRLRYDSRPVGTWSADGTGALIDAGADLEARTDDALTPLLAACGAGEIRAAAQLKAAGADTDARDREGDACLARAVREREAVDVRALAEAIDADTDARSAALVKAGLRRRVEAVRALLTLGANARVLTAGDRSPLARWLERDEAADRALVAALQAHHDRGADVFTDGGRALLQRRLGDAADTATLLALGADPDARDAQGESVLHAAAYGPSAPDLSALRALVEAGADIDARDARGRTPLLRALASGWGARAALFLDAGADPAVQTPDGQDVWRAAVANAGRSADRAGAIDALAERGIPLPPVTDHGDLLVRLRDDPEATRALLEAGADPNQADERGVLPLFDATAYGDPETVRHLVDAGADLRARDSSGNSPIVRATDAGRAELVAFFIEAYRDRGLDPLAAETRYRTPLAVALRRARLPSTVLLLEAGAIPDDDERRRLLEIAEWDRRSEADRTAIARIRVLLGLPPRE